ncbi:MAG TPA: WD40 repeat domain-containing protein [Tenuifilaceae bacterium]|nr:WD40 repeat domain-containing protein [Tenuifilaceae bacterium]HPJ46737.1 WD40 repeat domain-containing protein [Tenuifilaceae bacterium]HPQ33260.1 WD40 repeat domain-containing protein [Tenuifilaceae bacterium]
MKNICFLLLLFFDFVLIFGQSENPKPYKILKGHKHKINSICFNNTGDLLASAGWDNTVRIWDMNTYQEKFVLLGHEDNVWGAIYSPDDKFLISGAMDASMILWDVATGKKIKKMTVEPKQAKLKGIIPELDFELPNSLVPGVYNPSGDLLFAGSTDGLIRIFDMNKLQFIDTLYGHKGPVSNFAISTDGKLMATGSWQNELVVWDLETLKIVHYIKTKNNSAYSLKFMSNDTQLFSAGHNSINIWDIESETIIKTFEGQTGMQECKFSSDGKYLASCAEDYTVWLRDFETEEVIWKYRGSKMEISTLDFSPDGKYLVVGTPESVILIWKLVDLIK